MIRERRKLGSGSRRIAAVLMRQHFFVADCALEQLVGKHNMHLIAGHGSLRGIGGGGVEK